MAGRKIFNVFSKGQKDSVGPEAEKVPANYQALREENLQLKRALDELSILNELARAISASLDSEEIIQKIGIVFRQGIRLGNKQQYDGKHPKF